MVINLKRPFFVFFTTEVKFDFASDLKFDLMICSKPSNLKKDSKMGQICHDDVIFSSQTPLLCVGVCECVCAPSEVLFWSKDTVLSMRPTN